MFCRHKWTVLEKTLMPSAFDTLKSNGANLKSASNVDVAELSRRKLVLVLQCTKCGKLDKTIETNPGYI